MTQTVRPSLSGPLHTRTSPPKNPPQRNKSPPALRIIFCGATLRFIRNARGLAVHGLRGNVAAWRQIWGGWRVHFEGGGAELAKMAPDGSYNGQRIQIKIAALQIATINPL